MALERSLILENEGWTFRKDSNSCQHLDCLEIVHSPERTGPYLVEWKKLKRDGGAKNWKPPFLHAYIPSQGKPGTIFSNIILRTLLALIS